MDNPFYSNMNLKVFHYNNDEYKQSFVEKNGVSKKIILTICGACGQTLCGVGCTGSGKAEGNHVSKLKF